MHQSATPLINETTLNTNLNELVHSLVRELSMAARKVAIYGHAHPVAGRAQEKPFMLLGNIFKFKRTLGINLLKGSLYMANICLKDSVFTNDLIQYFQVQDVTALQFHDQLTAHELNIFLDRFVKRVRTTDQSILLSSWLEEEKIDTINVNSERAFIAFETHRQYRGEVDGDFSVRGIALQQLPDSLDELLAIERGGDDILDKYHIEFKHEVVKYILPEKVAAMSWKMVRSQLVDIVSNVESTDDSVRREEFISKYKAACRMVEHHPDRKQFIEDIENQMERVDSSGELSHEINASTGSIKIDSSRQIDELLDSFFSSQGDSTQISQFGDSFARLLKTGQRERAELKVKSLIDQLSSEDSDIRQKSLSLLEVCITELGRYPDQSILDNVEENIVGRLTRKEETYEYSVLLWQILDMSLDQENYGRIVRITSAMAGRRSLEQSVSIYDSMVVKQVFSQLSRSEVLDYLIKKLIAANSKTCGQIREILINIGSEEVALALTNIISHPVRNVRQQALKILAELGKPALKVCSQILVDDSMFERDSERHELSDETWYIIRNSVFVLGLLKDVEGVVPLRLRINDLDVRVRREIISALEKIGGEDACDLLVLMASDSDREIRERAVITVGLIGNSDAAPLVIDIARRNPAIAVHTVTALGKLGGDESREFLEGLLESEQELSEIAGAEISRDDLRLAVLKSLATIGHRQSIEKIRDYRDKLSATQKLFFKNSPVNRAIADILSRQ